jgi:hypothetical protein
MTLKEKFEDVEWINEDSGIAHGIENENGLEQCEKIADEFAIGFAEWITQAELPLKELLEIYKKQIR